MLKKRKLGKSLEVSAIGLGCMGLTWAYGETNKQESIQVLKRAYELGVNFWDTAEIYGPYNNEELIGEVLKSLPRDKLIIATKFGMQINDEKKIVGLNSSSAHVRKALEGSLKRLGVDYIDLYYQHRLDPNVPIEDVIHTLSECVKEGKIRHIGLSEVGAKTIRRAHSVHPLTAVQSEYSIWERGVEEAVLPTLKELGIGFVPYSPLGRGFLTGKLQSVKDLGDTDWRRENFPRIQPEHLEHNLKLVNMIKTIAAANHVKPSQIALAWVLRQGEHIVPIPGTKHVNYLEENVESLNIKIPDSAWSELDAFVSTFTPAGGRYTKENMAFLNRD